MGGLFIAAPNPPPVGTKLRLAFEVPNGNVRAEAIVRSIVPGEGMGVEFTKIDLKDRVLLQRLLKRLLC
jgi:PilZ domain